MQCSFRIQSYFLCELAFGICVCFLYSSLSKLHPVHDRATIHFHMNEIGMERMNGNERQVCGRLAALAVATTIEPLCELWINANRKHVEIWERFRPHF